MSRELRFSFFNGLADIFGQTLRPGQSGRHVSGREQHAAEHKFLDRVGVGARCVEYYDAGLGAAIQRNVVDARASSGNRLQLFRKFHFVHILTAHQNGVRVLGLVCQYVAFRQMGETDRRNFI